MSPDPNRKARSQSGTKKPSGEVAKLSFEKALGQLEHIVEELEDGSLPLDEALARFERGTLLSRHLEKELRQAEIRVRRLVGEEGEPSALEEIGEPEVARADHPENETGEEEEDNGNPEIPF